MVFKAERYVDIPTKDILSYIFDKPEYDQNKPVSAAYNPTWLRLSCQFNFYIQL